nr:immunoglobulin light chain junction region [Macaca mulatta]MOW02988.1 immunoglobulin light chain junction region [Macaca mulatta]MOW03494.1 immunoglobulin light chain junction region [Macaca mulatta]MOW03895.1 immunoglobulin light chain junction region [Macaca mulatta]
DYYCYSTDTSRNGLF